ncbi:MAG: AbrB family transcriptional regulator [Meiothermus sp.]
MATGRVGRRFQITLPVSVRKALGIKPGDKVEYKVVDGKLEIRVLRPNMLEVLDQTLREYDFVALHEETGGDAVKYVREMRGWNDE